MHTMYFLINFFFLPGIHAFVAVEIHQYSSYEPRSPCAFIRNASFLDDVSIQTCIWECVHEYDCQTAVYFDKEKICSMFTELSETGNIQSSGVVDASVIVYRKNHDPVTTCPSTATPHREETTTIAHIPVFQLITNSNDPIVAIYNTTAGGSSLNSTAGNGSGQYRVGQGPRKCIDFLNTTCLNFGHSSLGGTPSNTAGVGTGIYTIPQVGASVLHSFQFQTGSDYPNRDPLNITLEGSNATDSSLSVGSSWKLIYSGPTGLEPFNVTRLAWGAMQNFSNSASFTAYRMLVTWHRGPAICTQFSEIHLFGLV